MSFPITKELESPQPEELIDLIAKPGWQVEIQNETGFKDRFKLYIHDEKGRTLVRVCKLTDEQFKLTALLD